jgi:hypothetical protein
MLDALPLIFADATEAHLDDALLLEGKGLAQPGRDYFSVTEGHVIGCACCAPRNGAGMALSRLLLARARGQGVFFRRVVAVTKSEAGRAAVLHALANDPLASACFMLAGTAADGLSPAAVGS